jgi:hypothetical protein
VSYSLKPDKLYLLSFWAKKIKTGSEYNGRNPQITLVMKNPLNGKSYTQSVVVEERDKWSQYFIRFSTANDYTDMRIYSRASGTNALTLWLDDFDIVELTDKLYNVIKTPDTRLHVWNNERTLEYKENIDYELIEAGEIDLVNPLQGKKTIIKRLDQGSITKGSRIRVDYDFAASLVRSGAQWVTMSDPTFYNEYENLSVRPTMTYLKPEFVFINIDEVRGVNRDSRAQKRGLSNYQVLANFTNKVIDVIKSYDSNVEIMSWDDMWNPYHNGDDEDYQISYGGPPGAMAPAIDLINKDLIQISWYYRSADYEQVGEKIKKSPLLFNQKGLEFLGGPGVFEDPLKERAGQSLESIKDWSYFCYKYNALGMIAHFFYDSAVYTPEAANYSWNAVKQ